MRDPSKPMFWLLAGILVKGIPFIFLLHNRPPSEIPGIWGGTVDGDTYSYLHPIDNLLSAGSYSPDYRMPGYGFLYFFFRLVFSQVIACNILVLLQYILAGISVYYLALSARIIFKNDRLFYLVYFLFLFSTYSNYYDGWLLTESFCSSALIFGGYFFVKYFSSARKNNLVLSGVFIAWTIFLRPVFFPLVLLFPVLILLSKQGETGKQRSSKGLIYFLLPFIITETAWVSRNYIVHKKLAILTQTFVAPQAETPFHRRPLFEFIRSWGGSADFTDGQSALLWFGYHTQNMARAPIFMKPLQNIFILPNSIKTVC